MDEAEYQKQALDALAADFDAYTGPDGTGVWGRSLRDANQQVRIDVLLRAKSHVAETGFTRTPFGLEVKAPGEGRKLYDLCFQAQDYMLSEYKLSQGYSRLAFVLIYPGFEIHDDFEYQNGRALRRYLQRWQVGELVLDGRGWWIGTDTLYARTDRDGRVYMTNVKNHPLVTPRYGNYTASKSRNTHGNGRAA